MQEISTFNQTPDFGEIFTFLLDLDTIKPIKPKFFTSLQEEEIFVKNTAKECINQINQQFQINLTDLESLNRIKKLIRSKLYGIDYNFNAYQVDIKNTGKIDEMRTTRDNVYKLELTKEPNCLILVKTVKRILEDDQYTSKFKNIDTSDYFLGNIEYREHVINRARQSLGYKPSQSADTGR